jgi:hypothetical protein
MVADDYEMQHTAHNRRDLKRNMVHDHMDWTHVSQSHGPKLSCYKHATELWIPQSWDFFLLVEQQDLVP